VRRAAACPTRRVTGPVLAEPPETLPWVRVSPAEVSVSPGPSRRPASYPQSRTITRPALRPRCQANPQPAGAHHGVPRPEAAAQQETTRFTPSLCHLRSRTTCEKAGSHGARLSISGKDEAPGSSPPRPTTDPDQRKRWSLVLRLPARSDASRLGMRSAGGACRAKMPRMLPISPAGSSWPCRCVPGANHAGSPSGCWH
jgi:hypothetical protein